MPGSKTPASAGKASSSERQSNRTKALCFPTGASGFVVVGTTAIAVNATQTTYRRQHPGSSPQLARVCHTRRDHHNDPGRVRGVQTHTGWNTKECRCIGMPAMPGIPSDRDMPGDAVVQYKDRAGRNAGTISWIVGSRADRIVDDSFLSIVERRTMSSEAV